MIRWAAAMVFIMGCSLPVYAQESDSSKAPERSDELPMSLERMEDILLALDPDTQANGSKFLLIIEDVQLFVFTDTRNNRMRVMTPVRTQQGITPNEMTRMMQANFDSALDARYAIAQDMLWGVFVHPLAQLQKNQLISGIGQVVNLARTYGTIYSGGALSFGGGDSEGLNRRLIEELLEKGEEV